MKILVATSKTQGERKNDFCFTEEGELVSFGFSGNVCPNETVDGPCGCRRSMVGMKTHKSTTTVEVADLRIGPEEYETALLASLDKSGFLRFIPAEELPETLRNEITLDK